MRAVEYLRKPEAIRERCENILRAGLAGELSHFAVDLEQLPAIADRVIAVTREAYPDLDIPYHGRFRHFAAGGADRLGAFARKLPRSSTPPDERARTYFDLVVTSVLLDAGAGERWRYRDEERGVELGRSEGLAVASLGMFSSGLFSDDPDRPFRATGRGLRAVSDASLATGFQVSAENPLVGLQGRVSLLRSLGEALEAHPDVFGEEARVGNMFDVLARSSSTPSNGAAIEARAVLALLLKCFSSIWPSRHELEGEPLGDVWRHPAAGGEGSSAGFVPFHKLTQWLTYSLIEPIEMAGLVVRDVDALTGLAEYRNGGLFVDLEAVRPKHDDVVSERHAPGSEIIVEWRALTVALLDRLAALVREGLGLTRDELPLARILEGGTWSAGRAVARERRPGGEPPIRIESDGTVF
jgi:hypothetical protein